MIKGMITVLYKNIIRILSVIYSLKPFKFYIYGKKKTKMDFRLNQFLLCV